MKRAKPSPLLLPPKRPLVWGDINIIHTTDTHGWLLGHQKASFPEPNYSGDFGDFSSFVHHMKNIAKRKGVDLLLVDSGDLHDGTGLVDGFPEGGVDAHDANEFFTKLPYDVLAIGNHELYVYANTLDMYNNFVPKCRGRYLSSNANIIIPGENGQPVSVPVGNRFVKFVTTQKRKVTALGVLFDFTANAPNTTVQKVQDMVKEKWFADAIREEPDLFLLAGHMPVANDEWPTVFNAVRKVHPYTPIIILGGHTHIRDCLQLDGRSMSLASGRYMETVGWMSMKFGKKGSDRNLTFTRRYLDPNRVTYEYHTRTSDVDFDTQEGRAITRGLKMLARRFRLSFTYGTAPRDLTLRQSPYSSGGSLLREFVERAIPFALEKDNKRANIPHIVIINTVLLSVARRVLPELNKAGTKQRRSLEALEKREKEMYARGEVDHVYHNWLKRMSKREKSINRRDEELTLGYVTKDSCRGRGDDIHHSPLPFYEYPDFIGSEAPALPDNTLIDLIFVRFVKDQLLEILNSLQTRKRYTESDIEQYSPVLVNAVWGIYAQATWNQTKSK
ncbi:hypothetical protein AMATHDRAFT_2449 [Amanita thiersii Skay4041]|uniref:Putative 5'-nucleotidase C-terminal domain-containing protein n=1 Tax=Amanita thiersii Skay4041 TaxID=703135 RepID=A0A2A9NVA1_9AGAR|nr:hypothetical protein AMATHDRAFT_2449 [Amanita thiersii Skay4041]